jgi:hypothetical protein
MRATAAERRQLRDRVHRATIEELRGYIDPWPEWAALGDEYEAAMPCPRCQRGQSAAFQCGPAALIDPSGLSWWCCRCRCRGTRFGLEREVLNNPDAIALVLADVLAEGVRR